MIVIVFFKADKEEKSIRKHHNVVMAYHNLEFWVEEFRSTFTGYVDLLEIIRRAKLNIGIGTFHSL